MGRAGCGRAPGRQGPAGRGLSAAGVPHPSSHPPLPRSPLPRPHPRRSGYLVWLLRMLTSTEIKARADFFAPFIMGLSDLDVRSFCDKWVDPMHEESDHVQLVALTDALQVGRAGGGGRGAGSGGWGQPRGRATWMEQCCTACGRQQGRSCSDRLRPPSSPPSAGPPPRRLPRPLAGARRRRRACGCRGRGARGHARLCARGLPSPPSPACTCSTAQATT